MPTGVNGPGSFVGEIVSLGVERRQFLRVMATSVVGAVAFSSCTGLGRQYEAQSRVLIPEDEVSAYESWYATACRGCSAGCGVLVRVVEGRAKKVEGNPDHPVNQGKLCARGQALVQEEYHPDRVTGPLLRSGARGTGTFSSTSWDTALDQLVTALQGAQGGAAPSIALITTPAMGHQGTLLASFAQALGADWLTLDPFAEAPLAAAAQRVFGQAALPSFDIQNAQYVLSFGADFLSSWLSPVSYGVQYGIFRQGNMNAGSFQPRTDRPRGHLVQVEPRFSMTAASADEWVWIRPGTEGLLALSMAQVILAEGLAHPSFTGAPSASLLAPYAPEQVADPTGVPADRIRQLARDFSQLGPSVALGGGSAGAQTNGTEALAAILALNLLVGNVGQPGGVQPGSPSPIPGIGSPAPATALSTWQQVVSKLQAGQYQVVLVHGANPVFHLPGALQLADALQHARLVVSFGSLVDDTALFADIVLPTSLPLEAWGDTVPQASPTAVLTTQQPVVYSLYDTRGFEDALLQVAQQMGGSVAQALPWATYKDLLQSQIAPLQQTSGGSVPAQPDAAQFWQTLLQQGGWWASATTAASPPASTGAFPSSLPAAQIDGDAAEYPYFLVPFLHNSLGNGDAAHLPWLQATPDPVTTVVWTTWAEVNPSMARQVGLQEGDVVRVESSAGAIEVPVYVSPAAPPEVIAVPFGQGHQGYGRWAKGRGQNPLAVLAALSDSTTGALAYAATRVRLTKVGRQVSLPKFEGGVPAYQLSGSEVLKTTAG